MNNADKQLYNLFYHGETLAVKEIVLRFRKGLTLFVSAYVKNIHDAEDIVSDTFVKVIIKKPKIKDENYFKTYLYKVAKNLALDYLKQKKKEVVFYDNYIFTEDKDLEENIENKNLVKAISKLKKEYRLIIYLRYYNDFSIEEISKIVSRNKKYVYNVLNRAKSELKVLLMEVKYERFR